MKPRLGFWRTAVLATIWVSTSSATNLVLNGDFSAGNVLFTSSYEYVQPGVDVMFPPAVYTITPQMKSPVDLHSLASGYFDRTTSGPQGAFMAVNGATNANRVVWEQEIPALRPNTAYFFSTWVSSWYSAAPALLQFSINGELLGQPFEAPLNAGQWRGFETTWNSEENTSATISIVNLNTIFSGNDFALDDIGLSTQSVIIPEPASPVLVALAALWAARRRKSIAERVGRFTTSLRSIVNRF